MKKTMIYVALATTLMATSAYANGSNNCERLGNSHNYRCNVDGVAYDVSNAQSSAAASAAAIAYANQRQSQTSTNTNSNDNANFTTNNNKVTSSNSNVNGGNSVNFEGNPAHTTSFNVGVGVGITARVGEGVRAQAVTNAADWLAAHGQKCLALEAMLEVHPDLKKLGKKVTCK